MRLNILIAGMAGQGINEISNILSKSLASAGYYVFNYREYHSLITGGHNFNVLSLADTPINSHEESYDIVIALANDIEIYKKNIKKNAIILASCDYCKNIVKINVENKKVENVYYAAALFKILGLDKEILKRYIERKFKGKSLYEDDLKALAAYDVDYKINLGLEKGKEENYIITGAEACGIAAIEAGLQVYLAYPMTPATSLLSFLANNQRKYDYLVYQPESEISVVNQALGASFAGAISMIGTSGGGFDLMTEALSMSGMTELPIVFYLASRPGPSTGLPTYYMQSDIKVALNAGHGEFSRVVVCPGDVESAFRLTKEAFYLAEKFKIPSIILTDKNLAESSFTIKNLDKYKINMPKPGKILGRDLVRTNSYEHDVCGNTLEEPLEIKKRFDYRLEKREAIKKEVARMRTYSVYGNKNAKKVIISTGSNKGAILDSLQSLDIKFIQINYLEPFADIAKEVKGREIYVLETNSTGMLADLIEKNLFIKIDKKHRILKYNSKPFMASDIISILGRGR